MRILHVIANLAPGTGGPAAVCVQMASAVARRGHEVAIETSDWRPPGAPPSPAAAPAAADGVRVRVHRSDIARVWPLSLGLLRAIPAAVRASDVVHLHSLYLPHTWATARACWRSGTPYLLRPHGTLDPYIYARHRWRKALVEALFQGRVLARAAAIHYTSAEEMRLAEPYARGAPGVVVPLGVAPGDYAALPPGERFRAAHPEVGARRIVLHLGRLNFKKGLDLLVPAFAAAQRRHGDLHLVLAGPDDGMGARVEAWLRQAGLRERATLTGMLGGADKLAAFAAAELFVLPSYSENFGLAVVEAMACGLPVLISDKVNIWRELQAAGAARVEPCEAEAFGRAMGELLADRDGLAGMAAAARRVVAERYDWETIAPALEAVYRGLAERGAPPPGGAGPP